MESVTGAGERLRVVRTMKRTCRDPGEELHATVGEMIDYDVATSCFSIDHFGASSRVLYTGGIMV